MNSTNKALPFIRDNLDSTLALIGAILSIALIAYLQLRMGNPVYVISAILAFLACVTYLMLKQHHKLSDISSILNLKATPSVLLLSDIAFFAIFIYSLWSFTLRPELYVMPMGHIISMAAMGAILAAKILFLPSQNSQTPLTLFQIILLALSLGWSNILLFPGIVGIDPWYHRLITLDMLNTSHIGYGYQGLPAMHLTIGSTSLITGLSYKMATMFSISTLQVVSDTLFIFLIGRLLFNAKIGLLAALLVGIANWHIFFSYWTIPNSLGATLVIITLYLILKFHKDRTKALIPLFILSMTVLLLTHAIATLWLAILLLTFWLGLVVYNKLFKEKLATRRLLAIALSFTIVMLVWWTFGTGHMRTLTILTESGFAPTSSLTYAPGTAPSAITPPEVIPPEVIPPEVIPPEVTPPEVAPPEVAPPEVIPPEVIPPEVTPPEVAPPEVTPPAWETLTGAPFEFLFNSSGMFLFLAMSFIGFFYMLSRKFGNPYTFLIGIAGVLILGIGYFPMLIGISVIEHRWWYMAEILLSIPLAVTLFLLSGLFKKNSLKAGLVIVVVFVISFLSIIGFPSNQTNRTFSKNQIVRFTFTTSETQAIQTVSTIYDGMIGMDDFYTAVKFTPESFIGLGDRIEGTSKYLFVKDFSQSSSRMILIREEIVNHPFGTGSGNFYKLNYDPRQVLTEQGFHKVYDSGSVSGFTR